MTRRMPGALITSIRRVFFVDVTMSSFWNHLDVESVMRGVAKSATAIAKKHCSLTGEKFWAYEVDGKKVRVYPSGVTKMYD